MRLSVWLAEGNRRVRRRTLPSHGGQNEVDTWVRHRLSRMHSHVRACLTHTSNQAFSNGCECEHSPGHAMTQRPRNFPRRSAI